MQRLAAQAPTGGQEWAYQRILAGDDICKANQDLHPEAVDLLRKIRRNNYYRPKVADPLSPIRLFRRLIGAVRASSTKTPPPSSPE